MPRCGILHKGRLLNPLGFIIEHLSTSLADPDLLPILEDLFACPNRAGAFGAYGQDIGEVNASFPFDDASLRVLAIWPDMSFEHVDLLDKNPILFVDDLQDLS